jgi:hypothetical protein
VEPKGLFTCRRQRPSSGSLKTMTVRPLRPGPSREGTPAARSRGRGVPVPRTPRRTSFLAAPDAVHEIVDGTLRAAEDRAGIRPRSERALRACGRCRSGHHGVEEATS